MKSSKAGKRKSSKKPRGKTTSKSVASKAARILATSTDADERAVAASALAQVETPEPETVIVSGGGPFGPIDVPKFVDGKVYKDFGKITLTSYSPFNIDDFAATVLAEVGVQSAVGFPCYTADNVAAAVRWLEYNGGYEVEVIDTTVWVRKRAQQ